MSLDVSTQLQRLLQVQCFDFRLTSITQSESQLYTDPDNDIMRCRWAVGYDECGEICGSFPWVDLDPESCSIMYTANQSVGYQAVAIMIEDFLPGSIVPMSSVGLHFLVLIVNSTDSCSVAPEFISPTPEDDSCVV